MKCATLKGSTHFFLYIGRNSNQTKNENEIENEIKNEIGNEIGNEKSYGNEIQKRYCNYTLLMV